MGKLIEYMTVRGLSAPTETGFETKADGHEVVIVGYKGNSTDVVIPVAIGGKPVVGIADRAFKGNKSLSSVTIPVSVSHIGENAFDDCAGLSSVTIPASVSSIGDGAFDGCAGLNRASRLVLGLVLYKELVVRGFLEPNNSAVLSQIEGNLESIVSGGAGTTARVSRVEIEVYYRQNIGRLIIDAVDTDFDRIKIPSAARTYIAQSITNFCLGPDQAAFNVLKSIVHIVNVLENTAIYMRRSYDADIANAANAQQSEMKNAEEDFRRRAKMAESKIPFAQLKNAANALNTTDIALSTWEGAVSAYHNVLDALSPVLRKRVQE